MAAMEILQTLWASARQTNRLLRLHTPLGNDVLVAERLDGWEAVDQGGFRFELSALSPNAMLPLDELLGAPVLVELLTADSRTDLRPFHGHVTAFERSGSNGGLARYRLVIEPWLSLLRYRQDSYGFHDLSVIEIVEQIFSHYTQGVVTPAWRWELADRSVYLKRSLTTQYQESDAAFVQRLLAEEGKRPPTAPFLATNNPLHYAPYITGARRWARRWKVSTWGWRCRCGGWFAFRWISGAVPIGC